MKWRYPVGSVGSTPAVAVDGTVYVTAQGTVGDLLAIHPDGTLAWSHHGVGAYASPTIGCDGTIYLDGNEQYDPGQQKFVADILIAVTPTGTRKWTVSDSARFDTFDNAPTPGPGGMIYAARQGIYGVHDDGSVAFHVGRSGGGPGQPNGDSVVPRVAVSRSGVAYGGIDDLDTNEGGTFAILSDGAVQWTLNGTASGRWTASRRSTPRSSLQRRR